VRTSAESSTTAVPSGGESARGEAVGACSPREMKMPIRSSVLGLTVGAGRLLPPTGESSANRRLSPAPVDAPVLAGSPGASPWRAAHLRLLRRRGSPWWCGKYPMTLDSNQIQCDVNSAALADVEPQGGGVAVW